MNTAPIGVSSLASAAPVQVEWLPPRMRLAQSLAAWLLVLVILQGSSMTLTVVLTYTPELDPLVQGVWLAMYVASTLGLFLAWGFNWIGWLFRYRLPLMLLLGGTVASVIWSINPGMTVDRSVHLVGGSLIALFIGMTLPLNRILSISWKVFFALLLGSIIAALAFRELGIEQYVDGQTAWKGMLSSKNHLGFWAAISVLLMLDRLYHEQKTAVRVVLAFGILMALVNLLFSNSATSLLAMLIAMVMAGYLYLARRFHLGLFAILLLGFLALTLSAMLFLQIDTAGLLGRSSDMTGRGLIWEQSWALVKQHPLGGLGYGTLWYPTNESLWVQESLYNLSWVAHHAHNGVLQIATEVGLPLTGLMVLYLVLQLIESVHLQFSRQVPGMLFVLAFLIAYLIGNYSESRLLVNRELYWIFFLLLPLAMMQVQAPAAQPASGHARRRFGLAVPAPPPDPNPEPASSGPAVVGAGSSAAISKFNVPPPMWGDDQNEKSMSMDAPAEVLQGEIVEPDTADRSGFRQDEPSERSSAPAQETSVADAPGAHSDRALQKARRLAERREAREAKARLLGTQSKRKLPREVGGGQSAGAQDNPASSKSAPQEPPLTSELKPKQD